jgi:hypothetical protein
MRRYAINHLRIDSGCMGQFLLTPVSVPEGATEDQAVQAGIDVGMKIERRGNPQGARWSFVGQFETDKFVDHGICLESKLISLGLDPKKYYF